jgi:predicted DsbA family dithiol-disulfide isomerase
VLANFGDKVKIVWRHKPLPFHKDAPLAHEATIEAFVQKGNDGFWKFHDKLFAGQKTPGMKRPQLETYAEELGLDMVKFKKALDDRTHKAAMEADVAASTKGGISGTPAFVINGYFINGAQPYTNFKKMIKLAMRDLKEGKGPKMAAPTKPAAAPAKAAAPPARPMPRKAPAPKPKKAPAPAPKAPAPAPKAPSADDAY